MTTKTALSSDCEYQIFKMQTISKKEKKKQKQQNMTDTQ
jgi:hypothetical protein